MHAKRQWPRWAVGLFALTGFILSVLAQGTDSSAPETNDEISEDASLDAQSDELEVLEDFDDSLEPDDADSLESADGDLMADDAADLDPSLDGAAAEGELSDADMQASMERFIPSEKISEDRPVSFPNDI